MFFFDERVKPLESVIHLGVRVDVINEGVARDATSCEAEVGYANVGRAAAFH